LSCFDSYCQFCDNDDHCLGIEFCNLEAVGSPEGKGLCQDLPPECPDDGYGDNHAQEDAYEITQFPYERTEGGTEAEDERPLWCDEHPGGEWFELSADPGKVIVVEIEYDNSAGGNLDLALVDSSGNDLATSARPPSGQSADGGVERIEYGVNPDRSAALDAAIQVRGSITGAKIAYRILVDVRDPVSCADDGHEENDVVGDAKPLPGTANTPFNDLEVCGDDVDWYTVDVPANHILTVNLEAPNRLGDVDIFLFDPDDTSVAIAQSESVNDSEQFHYESTDSSTVLVLVDLKHKVGKAVYDIDYNIIENDCNDIAEPNDSDTCVDATPVQDGDAFVGATSLNICEDLDYYEIVLNPLDRLTVTATYDPSQAAGEMQMTLFGRDRQSPFADTCGNFLLSASEQTVSGDSVLLIDEYEAELGGKFYILANKFSGIRVPYELEIDVTPGPPCVDDTYDTNGSDDDAANATELQPGEVVNNGPDSAIIGQRICDTNEDWFSITIPDGEQLTWKLDHDDTDGVIDAALIDSDGTSAVLDSNGDPVTLDANGELSVTNASGSDKTYYLKIAGKDGIPVRNGYWLFTYVGGIAPGNGPIDTTCPDIYENNDVDPEAAELSLGTHDGLLICSVDDGGGDWYKTQVGAGETITVTATFDNPEGNAFLRLYQASDRSNDVARGTASGDVYTATYTSARDQFIYYRIDTSSGVAGDLYSVDVGITAAASCQDDRFDGNIDPTTAEALDAPGLYMRMMVCDDEGDWYAVELTENQRFEAYINYDDSLADIDVEIYAASDTSTVLATGPVSAEVTPADDGNDTSTYTETYYVRVASADPTVSVRLAYDLLLYRDLDGDSLFGDDEGPEDRACPDAYEDNDSDAAAASIPAGSYNGLRICVGNPTDDDYYTVYVPPGATITAEITFDSNHNVDLKLKNEIGTQVDSSLSPVGATTEVVTATNNSSLGAQYVVHVDGGTGSYQTDYTMDVDLAFPLDCSTEFPDQFDPNGDMASAQTLSSDAYDLILCEGTEDWFEVTLPDGEELEANVELRNRLGNVDVELLDSNGDALVDGNGDLIPTTVAKTDQDIESIVYENTTGSSQTLHLRVYPRDGAFMRNEYDLWLKVGATLPTAPYCPDAYERNDTTDTAATLDISSESQFNDMIACGAEDDWYMVQLQSGTTYDANVFFDHSSGFDLDIAVVDANGTAVADENSTDIEFGVHSTDNDEQTSFTAPSSGTYFFGVRNHGTAADGYRMHFASQSAACPEDGYESNNNTSSAAVIGPELPIDIPAGACSDDDFFKWVAPTDGTVTMSLLMDNSSVNFGLRAEEYNSSGLVGIAGSDEGIVTPTDDNRAAFSFSATAGNTYVIQVSRGTDSNGDTTNGAYFLTIE
jgi:hypothetical protein